MIRILLDVLDLFNLNSKGLLEKALYHVPKQTVGHMVKFCALVERKVCSKYKKVKIYVLELLP